MVARNSLVQDESFLVVLDLLLRLIAIDVNEARAASVGRQTLAVEKVSSFADTSRSPPASAPAPPETNPSTGGCTRCALALSQAPESLASDSRHSPRTAYADGQRASG